MVLLLFRMLSRIILHMEKGGILILKDLEGIYGALYDMLNMNYTVVAGQRRCRVAMGPHSNPLCSVHPTFRCIVLMDPRCMDTQDPPFLNRFEKQSVNWREALGPEREEIAIELESWIERISTPSQIPEAMFTMGHHHHLVL